MPNPDSDFWDEPLPDLPPKWSGPLSIQGLGPIFTATYESDCTSCDDPIVPGEDARADGHGGWIHADDQCERIATAERPTRTPGRPGMPMCPRCWLHHAGECL